MSVNSLPKAVNRQRRGCDLNPGPSAPGSSTLTTRLPSHPVALFATLFKTDGQCNMLKIIIQEARRVRQYTKVTLLYADG